MKIEDLKGKRLAVFGANNVTEEVTAFARRYGIVLVSVGWAKKTSHTISALKYSEPAVLP